MHDGRKDAAGRIACLQDKSPCAISEQNTCIAVFPIDKSGKSFRTDYQSALDGTASDCLRPHVQGKNKPCARGQQVKCAGLCCTKLVLYEAGGCRKNIFWRGGCTNDQI